MYKGVSDLSQHITPQTCGIVWLTDEPINYSSPGMYEFNYLLDGLVVKSLEENSEREQKSNFFLGDNFGNPFFLGHVVVQNKDDFKIIYDHFKVGESFIQDNSTVYIYNKSQNTASINVLKELRNTFQTLEFKNLNI